MNAQQKWRHKQRALGNCIWCGQPRPAGDNLFCAACRLKSRTAARQWKRKQLGCQPWQPGGPGRPPKERTEEEE